MTLIAARAMKLPVGPFETILIDRRDLDPHDIWIDIAYAGICHSDVHHARAEWGHTTFPIVPGHEITGTVSRIGESVANFEVGDTVGVGCMVGSCRTCDNCLAGMEQYCHSGHILTYNAVDERGRRTYGGYSQAIVVDEAFAVRIPEGVDLARAAPLMCAGITLYSPLRHWGAAAGKRVGIVGFGGLGHVGTQISHALGAHTTVFNLGSASKPDAMRLGADDYRDPSTADEFAVLAGTFDLIISTVPVSYDLNSYLGLLRIDGTMVNLGVPEKPLEVVPHSLLNNRRSLAGSLIGGIAETQEMINFCAAHQIGAEVEIVGADEIDDAYDRLSAGDIRYRAVIDVSTIGTATPPAADAIVAPV